MKPEDVLHPLVTQSVRRYLSYRWGDAIIQGLIRYRLNVKLSVRCIDAMRSDAACGARCQSRCPFKKNVM